MEITHAWRVNEILLLRPNGPDGSKCTIDHKVLSLAKELGLRRATRGRRAGQHVQAKRRRNQLMNYVIDHVTSKNKNNNHEKMPVIVGNRRFDSR